MERVLLTFYMLTSLVAYTLANKEIRLPPTIVEPRSKTLHYYKENDLVKIPCTATGIPKPTYEWRRNGKIINTHNITFNEVTGLLTIPSLSAREEGIFSCRATTHFLNGHSATAVSVDVEIHVLRVGDFKKSATKTFQGQEGHYLKLACDVHLPQNADPPIYKWFTVAADTTLTEITEDERKYIDQMGTLHFSWLLKQDELPAGSSYQCGVVRSDQAKPLMGSDNFVTVTRSGMLHYNTTGKLLEVLVSKDVVLECIFGIYINTNGAVRVPEVKWYDDAGHNIVTGDKYTIASNGRSLRITNVQESDEKTYICRGTSSVGSDEGRMPLNVTTTPIWVKTLASQTVLEGANVKLNCNARSALGEIPPDSPVWYLNGMHMDTTYDSKKYVFSSDKKELTVMRVKKDIDTNCFQCTVSNSKGSELGNGCLNVLLPIVIVDSPRLKQEIRKGDVVNLTVLATSDPSTTLTYKWIFKGYTYDDLHPLPHVTGNPSTRAAHIYTSHLQDSDMLDITGVYRLEVSTQYEVKYLEITVTVKTTPEPQTHRPPDHLSSAAFIMEGMLEIVVLVLMAVAIILFCGRYAGSS